jgi:hypothetical protein
MSKFSPTGPSRHSVFFRYIYYVVSAVRLKSFRQWRNDGEPNPFVRKTYKRVVTERAEFTDIFDDVLKSARPRSHDAS